MRCPYCGAEAGEASRCPGCGNPLIQTEGSLRESPAASVLREHLASPLFLVLICLTAAQALLQTVLSLIDLGRFHLTVNGQPSPIGSALLALAVCLPILLALWRTRSSALAGEREQISTAAFTLGKLLSILLMLVSFAGFVVLFIAFAAVVQTSPDTLAQQVSQELPEVVEALIPEGARAGIARELILVSSLLLALFLLQLVLSVSLLRCSSAAKRIVRQGRAAKISRLTGALLLADGVLLALGSVVNIQNDGVLPVAAGLATDLLLAAALLVSGLLVLRCRKGMDQLATPRGPA